MTNKEYLVSKADQFGYFLRNSICSKFVIKMKLFCFLITFVIVNVLANDEVTYYKEVVFLTNEAIEIAYSTNDLIVGDISSINGLEHVIEKMVNDEDSYKCFAQLNLMIAVPDQTDLINYIPRLDCFSLRGMEDVTPMKRCIDYQDFMQHEMKYTLGIDYPIADENQDFEGLNLTTLAEQRRSWVKTALKNIFRRKLRSMYDQFMLQLGIRNTLNLVGSNLATLIEERRISGTSLENTIRRRVLGTNIPEVVEDQNGSVRDYSLLPLCRLMGLYLSTLFPTSYIKELWINPNVSTCTMDDGTTLRVFKKINGVWSQISSINQLLEDLLI
ncbi:uncharacterized protein LOC126847193 [Adelges cooleyi]|uniref:uncharacterized protein LOC126847193 n=1 Tax=Adelges cooleyi TaxID=133065 RepID=UPI00218037F0|nr:uncharacterized protein LOC126847193 [Adelges cooleyi]